MTRIDLTRVQQDLSDCLRRVASGESFVIVQDGQPLAELRPHLLPRPRQPLRYPTATTRLDADESPYPDEYGAGD